jgi:signal transduction histidine kinase
MPNLWFLLCTSQSQGISKEQIALIIYVIVALFLFSFLFILFFSTFQRRKNELLLDKINQQKVFDEELVKTQQEIQEETLKHVGRELHDNIGQMLVMSVMQMSAALKVVGEDAKPKMINATDTLKSTLEEVRALSKSLNNDVIFNLGFDVTVENEIERLNKTGLVSSELKIIGDKVNFENKKDELILFRILQEFFSNTIKYAEAENLNVTMHYREDELEIIAVDDGTGFDISTTEKGSGLINMTKRAEMINAKFKLESEPEKGTRFNLVYPYRTL